MTRQVPQRAAIYARISLDRTGQAMGVNRQIRECREHADRLGWGLTGQPYRDNDISAKSGAVRPAWERLLADIRAGEVDGVVAVHLDRLLRRVRDVERLLDTIKEAPSPVQVSFVNAGDLDLNTASGKMLARILATVAANESEQKGERVRSARRAEAMSGRLHSVLGYGYNRDRSINPGEAAVIREMAERLLAGETLYALAKDLNERGVPTPGAGRWTSRQVAREAAADDAQPALVGFVSACRSEEATPAADVARWLRALDGHQQDGSAWTAGAVRRHQGLSTWLLAGDRQAGDGDIAVTLTECGVPGPATQWRVANLGTMLRRGSLCGWRDYQPGGRGGRGEMVAEGDWAPILTRDTTEAIRLITDRREKLPGGRKPKYLLSGIVTCGRCGAPMGGSPATANGRARYACSQQPGLDRCGRTTVVADPVERLVTEALLRAITQVPVGGRRLRRTGGTRSSTAAEMDAAERTLEEVRDLRRTYAGRAASGALTPEEYDIIREGLDQRQREAERVLGAYAPPVQEVLKGVPRNLPALREYWERLGFEGRRSLVVQFIERVAIQPGQRGGHVFDASRIGAPVFRF